MAHSILKKFHPSAKLLDDMIFRLETNLGHKHTVSPFVQLNQKYQYSTLNSSATKVVLEEVKSVVSPQVEKPAAVEQVVKEVEEVKKSEAQQQPKPKGGKKPVVKVEEGPKLEEVWEVYSKCDLRVGKILECEPLPESDKIYREVIDLGEGEPRLIGSGLNHLIPIDEMLSGLVVVFANLKPRKLGSIMSNGMVMCASNGDHSVVELIRPPEGSKIGDRVQLSGNPILGVLLSEKPEEVLNPKKKYVERFLPLLKTNDKCEATYNGVTLQTSAGVLVSKSLTNSHIA